MAKFTSLPSELRSQIFALAKPTSTSIHIREAADLVVTAISSPPGLLTTSKETRTESQKWGLKPYPILVGDDYQDVLFDEDTSLHLTITPSTAEHLSITWTELYTVLGDALLDAKRVIIECSEPARLARLFMLPEAELVGVGQSCVEAGLFGSEILASDRETREALHGEISVFVGDDEWVLREEGVEGFGEVKASETKAFVKTSALYFQDAERERVDDADEMYFQVDEAESERSSGDDEAVKTSALYFQDAEGVEVMKESRERLTKGALGRLCAEMTKLYPEKVYLVESDPGGSVMPED